MCLPEGTKDFMVYSNASIQGLGCEMMQRDKVIMYTSRQMKIHEKNDATHNLPRARHAQPKQRYAFHEPLFRQH